MVSSGILGYSPRHARAVESNQLQCGPGLRASSQARGGGVEPEQVVGRRGCFAHDAHACGARVAVSDRGHVVPAGPRLENVAGAVTGAGRAGVAAGQDTCVCQRAFKYSFPSEKRVAAARGGLGRLRQLGRFWFPATLNEKQTSRKSHRAHRGRGDEAASGHR